MPIKGMMSERSSKVIGENDRYIQIRINNSTVPNFVMKVVHTCNQAHTKIWPNMLNSERVTVVQSLKIRYYTSVFDIAKIGVYL